MDLELLFMVNQINPLKLTHALKSYYSEIMTWR